VDAISGFVFSSLINLETRGLSREDVVVMPYPEYGADLYGNAIIVSDKLIENHPEAIAGFLRAYTRGLRDVVKDPDAAIEYVRQRDSLIDVPTEQSRLRLTIESTIDTPAARKNGIGAVDMERLQRTIDQVALAYKLPPENVPEAAEVFDSSFLPEADARRIFD
jgi:NitT/TauT family transport system substrate-binding protein